MFSFILIVVCVVAGFALKRTHKLPKNAHKAINVWLMNIALPAVALKYIPQIQWSTDLIIPLSMPFVIWFGAVIFIKFINKKVKTMTPATQTSLILVAGLSNTSFLGFPITSAFYGDKGLQVAVLCDQACFIVMSTFGVILAIKTAQNGAFSYKSIGKKIITFPPLIASVFALLTSSFIDFSLLLPLVDKIAATLVPLALFSVGLQLSIKDWKADARYISIGLAYKLILAPLLFLCIALIVKSKGIIPQVSILEAAMAPMVTGAILAADYDLNPKLANMVLGFGIPLSFISTGSK